MNIEIHPVMPGQVFLEVPSVRGVVIRDNKGDLQVKDNITDPRVLKEIDDVLTNPSHSEHRRFSSAWNALKEQIPSGRKVAVFAVTFGAITITVASLGYEVFGRGGKDIKHLFELLENHREKKQK